MPQVQIPEELLVNLIKWHLWDVRDPDLETQIRSGLQDKLDRMMARVEYERKLSKRVDKDTLNHK